MPRWKTTLLLLLTTVGIGTYISLYELRQPTPEEREHRSKEVLSLKPDDIMQLVLDLPQAKATLTRDAATWKIEPQKVRADSELVARILEECAPLMAERILSPTGEHPLDLKAYGLEPAVGWLSFATKTTSVTLLIGETTAVGNNRYAKVPTRPEVFIIPPTLFEAANVPAATLRDAQLLRLEAWLVDGLTIRSAHGTLTLTRKDNEWQLITQLVEDRADRSAVNALLTRLGNIKIQRFVDDAPTVEQVPQWGLDRPNAEVTLTQSEPPAALTLFVGTNLPEDAALLYAKRSDEPSLYAIAAPDVTALLATTVEQLRSGADQPAGAHDPLRDGGVDEHREDQQRPPEEVVPERSPGHKAAEP